MRPAKGPAGADGVGRNPETESVRGAQQIGYLGRVSCKAIRGRTGPLTPGAGAPGTGRGSLPALVLQLLQLLVEGQDNETAALSTQPPRAACARATVISWLSSGGETRLNKALFICADCVHCTSRPPSSHGTAQIGPGSAQHREERAPALDRGCLGCRSVGDSRHPGLAP
ncbi:unnamed protein product [Lota lota]